MIFTVRDVELLRLLRWCRYIMPEKLKGQFDAVTISNLKSLKLIRANKTHDALTLTASGGQFLDRLFQDMPGNVRLAHTAADTIRRIRVSSVTVTAYQAGFDVFTTELASLDQSGAYFLPMLMRGKGVNPWSNSRIAALLRLGDSLYAAHYVCPNIGDMLLIDELNTFMNNTARITNVRRAMIFAGESYEDILAELDRLPGKESTRYVSYAGAFRQIEMPVHLLPCDATGAMQLRLMGIPDYRRKLCRAALKAQYAESPSDVPSWDAMFEGKPFIVAADMDLRRIDAAIQAAKERGLGPVSMVALKPQVDAVLKRRYREKGLARVFTLKDEMLRELGVSQLYVPSPDAYKTEKGEVVDAPLIQAARRT